MKKAFLFVVSIFFSVFVFAQLNVISPIEGTFANRQMLVLETDGSGECFYSLNGSEPEAFGLPTMARFSLILTVLSKSALQKQESARKKLQ